MDGSMTSSRRWNETQSCPCLGIFCFAASSRMRRRRSRRRVFRMFVFCYFLGTQITGVIRHQPTKHQDIDVMIFMYELVHIFALWRREEHGQKNHKKALGDFYLYIGWNGYFGKGICCDWSRRPSNSVVSFLSLSLHTILLWIERWKDVPKHSPSRFDGKKIFFFRRQRLSNLFCRRLCLLQKRIKYNFK